MAKETEQEIRAIANEAYVYLYPLVLMDMTRRVMTNAEPKDNSLSGPINMFHHLRAFPPPDFKDALRPNFDTLYSIAWLDVSEEPMILSAPDTKGRYYVMEITDMWDETRQAHQRNCAGNLCHRPAGMGRQAAQGCGAHRCTDDVYVDPRANLHERAEGLRGRPQGAGRIPDLAAL